MTFKRLIDGAATNAGTASTSMTTLSNASGIFMKSACWQPIDIACTAVDDGRRMVTFGMIVCAKAIEALIKSHVTSISAIRNRENMVFDLAPLCHRHRRWLADFHVLRS